MGGRVEGWLPGDFLRLGVTAVDETTDTVDLQVVAADARLKFSEGSFLDVEVAESKGNGFGRSFSADGGFTYVNLGGGGATTRAGALRTEGKLDLGDVIDGANGMVSAYFEQKDAGSRPSRKTSLPIRRSGALPLRSRSTTGLASALRLRISTATTATSAARSRQNWHMQSTR
jgi:hypothetical protein